MKREKERRISLRRFFKSINEWKWDFFIKRNSLPLYWQKNGQERTVLLELCLRTATMLFLFNQMLMSSSSARKLQLTNEDFSRISHWLKNDEFPWRKISFVIEDAFSHWNELIMLNKKIYNLLLFFYSLHDECEQSLIMWNCNVPANSSEENLLYTQNHFHEYPNPRWKRSFLIR